MTYLVHDHPNQSIRGGRRIRGSSDYAKITGSDWRVIKKVCANAVLAHQIRFTIIILCEWRGLLKAAMKSSNLIVIKNLLFLWYWTILKCAVGTPHLGRVRLKTSEMFSKRLSITVFAITEYYMNGFVKLIRFIKITFFFS